VIDALVTFYASFSTETRVLPVMWHQSLLVFVQRYKHDLTPTQRNAIKT
jgi:essential nuclear protein 1